jgi:hypothetical protein
LPRIARDSGDRLGKEMFSVSDLGAYSTFVGVTVYLVSVLVFLRIGNVIAHIRNDQVGIIEPQESFDRLARAPGRGQTIEEIFVQLRDLRIAVEQIGTYERQGEVAIEERTPNEVCANYRDTDCGCWKRGRGDPGPTRDTERIRVSA